MVRFRLTYLNCLRNPTGSWHEYQDEIETRLAYRTKADRVPYSWSNRTYGASWQSLNISEEHYRLCLVNLIDLAREIFDMGPKVKLTISGDFGYLYSNCPHSLAVIQNKNYLDHVLFRQARVVKPTGVVALHKSDFRFRTYLRNRYLTDADRLKLADFFKNNCDYMRIGPALAVWSTGEVSKYRHHWVQSHFFFDHLSSADPLLVNLVCPGIVRITLPIVVLNT